MKLYLVTCFVAHDQIIWNHVDHCFEVDIDQVILDMCLSYNNIFILVNSNNENIQEKCGRILKKTSGKMIYRVAGFPVDGM